MDIIGMHDGPPLVVHDPDTCAPWPCCIHRPSDHVATTWPLNWVGPYGGMQRVCPHHVGHPDPDDVAYRERAGIPWVDGHLCDGCCPSTDYAIVWDDCA
jgi:hypothetical protein